jgi:hypothetical protein
LSRRIIHYVNRDEVDAFFRKKLFRPQATASTRLGEQDQFVSDALHDQIRHCESPRCAVQRGLKYNPVQVDGGQPAIF